MWALGPSFIRRTTSPFPPRPPQAHPLPPPFPSPSVHTEADQRSRMSHSAHKSRKQEMSKMALSKVPPTAEESAVLHELMLDQSTSKRVEDGGKVIERVNMSETVVRLDPLELKSPPIQT